jgi:hypothetical protein
VQSRGGSFRKRSCFFFCDLQNGKKEGTWEGIRKGRNWIKVVGRYLV